VTQRLACCCIQQPPPTEVGCAACLTNLPTSITVTGAITVGVIIPNWVLQPDLSPPCPSVCAFFAPFPQPPNPPTFITLPFTETLYRWDDGTQTLNVGCNYYPLAGTEDVDCEDLGLIPGCKPINYTANRSYFELQLGASGCANYHTEASSRQYGVLHMTLRLKDPVTGGVWRPGTANEAADVQCACWELQIDIAQDLKKYVVQTCGLPAKVAEFDEGYVFDINGSPYIVDPFPFIKRTAGDPTIRSSCEEGSFGSFYMYRNVAASNEMTNGVWNRSSLRGRYVINQANSPNFCDAVAATSGDAYGYADIS